MSFTDPGNAAGTNGASLWTTPVAGIAPLSAVRHAYPLAIRNPSLATAIGLVMRSAPYAVMRFAVLMTASVVVLIWAAITIGGAVWLGTHIAHVFGWIWGIGGLLCASFIWSTILRYALHLIECGHVAVLTELITRGTIGNGSESMFAYGRRIVTERFAQANILFGLNALVRGVVNSIHRTLDWLAELLPIPGLDTVANLLDMVLKAATRYVDKVVFSYNLARNSTDPWTTSREGLVYYAQNARPVLKTAVWCVVLEKILSVLLWFVLLVPAGLITLMLPHSMRETGGVVTVLIALLLAGPIRAAFIKPIFLVMIMVRFHSAIEGQAIDANWDAQLATISDGFRTLGQDAAATYGKSRWARMGIG